MQSATRYWFDSFPGVDLDTAHPVLDSYGTPIGGPEDLLHEIAGPWREAYDALPDSYTPYTTRSQNRGGIA